MRLQKYKLLFHCLLLLRRMTVADGTVRNKHVEVVVSTRTDNSLVFLEQVAFMALNTLRKQQRGKAFIIVPLLYLCEPVRA